MPDSEAFNEPTDEERKAALDQFDEFERLASLRSFGSALPPIAAAGSSRIISPHSETDHPSFLCTS